MKERTKRRSFLKKVNEQFLHKLSVDDFNRFTHNIGGFIQVIEYVESNQFENGYEFMNNAFEWAQTPEGHNYWANVANVLRKVTVNYNENVTVDLDIVDKLKQQLNELSEENQKLKVDLYQANRKLNEPSKPYVSDWDTIYQKMKTSKELRGYQVISLIDGILWLSHKFYPPVSIRGDEDN